MALHHLPSHGWKVIYPIEPREFSSMEATTTSDVYSAVSHRAVTLGCYSSLFLHDLPLVLHKARMTMYADDSTLYMSAPKASEITEILNNESFSIRMDY